MRVEGKKPAPRDRIIFALDLPTRKEALHYAGLLKDSVGLFKIGLELFVSCGPDIVKAVREVSGRGIFLDLKFHDIPATVRSAYRAISNLGVEFTTVHCEGSRALSSIDALRGPVKALGVTLLTSLSEDDLEEMGIDPAYRALQELVLLRARTARKAGCSGVVCSGREAGVVKRHLGGDFIVVTPGIRTSEDLTEDDQKRVVTPYEAIYSGADYIVVGRPLRDAPDPITKAEEMAEEVQRALADKARG